MLNSVHILRLSGQNGWPKHGTIEYAFTSTGAVKCFIFLTRSLEF
jgi:hypothetical protein